MSDRHCLKMADEKYGFLRSPTKVHDWEKGVVPASRVLLDSIIGAKLKIYQELSVCPLFEASSSCFTFIWVMDTDCNIWISFEEISPLSKDGRTGHPRQRGASKHPAEEKKLGHPTLIDCGKARAAGELYLDQRDDKDRKMIWLVNTGSGRYCREHPPMDAQCKAIYKRFCEILGESVLWDDV